MVRVYIAGPYSHPDPVTNTAEAIAAGNALSALGFYPYIPHLSLFWHLLHPHEIGFWYKHDLAWLEVCDALLRLPGASTGADGEEARAHELGIPVYRTILEIERYFDAVEAQWYEPTATVVFEADPRLRAALAGNGPDD